MSAMFFAMAESTSLRTAGTYFLKSEKPETRRDSTKPLTTWNIPKRLMSVKAFDRRIEAMNRKTSRFLNTETRDDDEMRSSTRFERERTAFLAVSIAP